MVFNVFALVFFFKLCVVWRGVLSMPGDFVSQYDGTPLFFVQKEIIEHKLIVLFNSNHNNNIMFS